MHILPLTQSHIPEAAELFAAGFRRLRKSVPALPEHMEDPACAAGQLDVLLAHSAGIAAFSGGRMVGYLGWWLVDGFRGTQRKAGYVPAWAHALAEPQDAAALGMLYEAAAGAWYEAGCHAQAATLLADDPLTHRFWFWNNFGALVIDAVRPLTPLGIPQPQGMALRKATTADAELVSMLEAEHWQHYSKPPVLMVANAASGPAECAALLADPANCFWLAFEKNEAMGYLRFEPTGEGSSEVLKGAGTIACTGAYVRPRFRGRGAAPALLDAALRGFAEAGLQRCSVDFETFNPQASTFWMKYFTPVCLSVMRVPERSKA